MVCSRAPDCIRAAFQTLCLQPCTDLLQVGKSGMSVGIDVRKAAVKLSSSNIKRLRSTSQDFVSQASSCKFELHNVFMPSIKHKVSRHPPPCVVWQVLFSSQAYCFNRCQIDTAFLSGRCLHNNRKVEAPGLASSFRL